MSRASVPTLLSLHRFARIMGIDPLHFAQGYSTLRPLVGACPDIWYQYDWQDGDKVSRDQIMRLVGEAERDIADAILYWPAPTWIEGERHRYTKPQRTDLSGTAVGSRGQYKSVQTGRGYVISGGIRKTALLGTTGHALLDADGDGYHEWGVFTILGVSASLDVCEVQAFYKEYDEPTKVECRTDPTSVGADESWRVRPVYASLVGTTLTIRVPRWELFRPDLQEAMAVQEINADLVASYVENLTFYRVYNDPSIQVTFGWSDVESCESPACCWTTQTGCFKTRDSRNGHVVPAPGTYDAATGTFTTDLWAGCVEPDLVWLSYYAGLRPERQRGCDPLDDWWARVIALLAASRLDVKLCTCANVAKTVDILREDLAEVNRTRSYQNNPDVVSNPFGSRKGEVEAWKKIKGRRRRRGGTVKL